MTWKIVGASKASVIYIYIDIQIIKYNKKKEKKINALNKNHK